MNRALSLSRSLTGVLYGDPDGPRQDLHHVHAVQQVAPHAGAPPFGPRREQTQRGGNGGARVKDKRRAEEGEEGQAPRIHEGPNER